MRGLLITLLWGGSAVMGIAQGSEHDQVLFTVRNSPVYTHEFIYQFKKNNPKPEDYAADKIANYVDLLINFKLKITEAHQRGLDTTAAFAKEFNTYKEELKKPYIAGADDLDRLTRQAYERLKEEIKAAHILVTVKPDATPADTLAAYSRITALRKRAVAGEDFGELAKQNSDDPSAKSNGGNLGYFTALQMVFPFEEAAYATKTGDISPVVRTRFGYHILKVSDRLPARGEVEVSHILLRTGQGKDARAKDKIFEVYDQLKAGRSWDELCKEYSEDGSTKDTGGRLKPFGVGALAAVPEFEKMAFYLKTPGEISDPFQSNVGWHIIRLERKIPMPSFADMEPSLKRRVARDERLQLSKTRTLQKRKAEFGFTENSDSRKKVQALADTTLNRGKWAYRGAPEFKKATLFTLSSGNIAVGEFMAYVETHQKASALSPNAHLTQLYDRFVEEKINDAEEQKLLSGNPAFKQLLGEYRDGILLFEIMEKEVWNKASEDSTGQRKFYEEHRQKYQAGNRVEVRIFSTPDSNFANTMRKKIQRGDSLTVADVKKFKSVQRARAFEKGESKIVDRVNWVPGLQETQADGMYYLVDVVRLLLPGTKSFAEARASVISDYQDSLEKIWLEQLKQKYPVKVNKKAEKTVIAELRK
jgi:peptidyl-prolyl cis-trans isomerase SurA